jgi:RNA polymerase sigma-70 factor (ECF subfamily)
VVAAGATSTDHEYGSLLVEAKHAMWQFPEADLLCVWEGSHSPLVGLADVDYLGTVGVDPASPPGRGYLFYLHCGSFAVSWVIDARRAEKSRQDLETRTPRTPPLYIGGVRQRDELWDYRSDLERLARHLCRHTQDAEDVAHDALIKASEKLDGFRGEASVRTWLHAIAANECRMLRRRKTPSSLDHMFESAALDRLELGDDPIDPEEAALELEARREVLDALGDLPDRYQCALLLKDGNDLSLEETARLMETSVPAVKSILYRARSTLRDRIEKGGADGAIRS